jgi:predicted neuraminidase
MKRLFFLLLSCASLGAPNLRAAPVPADLPATCYLFAYFYHDRQADGLRLAWSRDGYAWTMLNGGESCLRPMVGETKLMRDPCLYRGPDGTFRLVWTTSWAGKTIGYASSTDLIHWSPQKAIPVMAHEPKTVNTWAPEIIWDPAKQDYLIFWSSTILGLNPQTANSNKAPTSNNRIYCTTTKDFETFTPTRLLYDGGFNVIDATLAPNDREWLMFVKNETLTPRTEKNIRMIRGASAEGPWGEASPAITGDYWAEGPTALKVGDEWRVYFDKHRLDAIGLVVSRDLKTWTDLSDKVSFPAHARHGTVIALPGTFMATLLAHESELGTPVLHSEFLNENAPYPECHASTIAEVAPGKFAAAWFGGTKERNPDVGIWFTRQENGKWAKPVEVANGIQPDGKPRLPTWNPVLFCPGSTEGAPLAGARASTSDAPTKPLLLFYKVGPSPSAWWGMVMSSTDGGKTWSAPQRLPDKILGPIKNKPVVLADGSWLAGSSTEGGPNGWQVHFERSADAGKTWQLIGPVGKGPGIDAIQPSILMHKNGSLEALCRTKQGVVAQTWSKDGGKTWSALTAIDLPNPNSGTDAVTLADGRQLIVYNHSAHRANEPKGNRYPLDVAISTDGIRWQHVLTLEEDPVGSGYAYPAVIQASDGRLHITYTWDRKKIKHVVLDPKKL